MQCMERCVLAGTIDCPEYLKWLVKSFKDKKDAPPIPDICDAFLDYENANWEGDEVRLPGNVTDEIDLAMERMHEERKAQIEKSYETYQHEGYL